jgi:hypothetical protein
MNHIFQIQTEFSKLALNLLKSDDEIIRVPGNRFQLSKDTEYIDPKTSAIINQEADRPIGIKQHQPVNLIELDDTCPVCKEKYESQCKCMLGDYTCKNGHTWHKCPVHGNKVLNSGHDRVSGLISRDKLNKICTCPQPNDEGFDEFFDKGMKDVQNRYKKNLQVSATIDTEFNKNAEESGVLSRFQDWADKLQPIRRDILDWWQSLSYQKKQDYLKHHPRSKLRFARHIDVEG